jgi:hypothetical protein
VAAHLDGVLLQDAVLDAGSGEKASFAPIFIAGTGTLLRAQSSLCQKRRTFPPTRSKVATTTFSLLCA